MYPGRALKKLFLDNPVITFCNALFAFTEKLFRESKRKCEDFLTFYENPCKNPGSSFIIQRINERS